VVGRELRHLQEILNHKADVVQREFIAAGEESRDLSRKIEETDGAERERLIATRSALHERQQAIADEVNEWRDRARAALRQPSEEALRAFLHDLAAGDDESVRSGAGRVLKMLDATDAELEQAAQERERARARPTTPVGRLAERARTEYDLRGDDPAPRKRTAFEFANRAGMAQNEDALAELEAALGDDDAIVKEVIALTLIEMHRFRALRLSDLDVAHASVERLASLNHRAAIRVLVEILETPRTGFKQGEDGVREGNNSRSRAVALARLAEWHNAEAQAAVRGRRFDRDPHIADEAQRLLEASPGEW